MCDIMDTKQKDVDDNEGKLRRGVDGGDESEEDIEGEGKQKDPGYDLLWMKRQLETMNTSPLSELLD